MSILPGMGSLAGLTASGLQYVGGYAEAWAGTVSTTAVSLTTLTGGIDTKPQALDIVVVAYGVGGSSDLAIAVTGYTSIVDIYVGDTIDSNLGVLYKLMTATPDTSITVSQTGDVADSGMVAIQVWRGVHQTTPIDVASTTATGANTAIADPPAITPVTGGAKVLVIGAAGNNGLTFTHAGLTHLVTTTPVDDTGSDGLVAMGSFETWTSGAYDPAVFAIAGSDNVGFSWTAATVVLRPI